MMSLIVESVCQFEESTDEELQCLIEYLEHEHTHYNGGGHCKRASQEDIERRIREKEIERLLRVERENELEERAEKRRARNLERARQRELREQVELNRRLEDESRLQMTRAEEYVRRLIRKHCELLIVSIN